MEGSGRYFWQLALSIGMQSLCVSDLFWYMAPPLGRHDLVAEGTDKCEMHNNLEGWLFSTTPGWPTTFSWFSWLNFTFLSSWVPSESHSTLFIVRNVCLFSVNFIGLAFLLTFLSWCLARLQAVEMYNKSLPVAPWYWFLRLNSIGDNFNTR